MREKKCFQQAKKTKKERKEKKKIPYVCMCVSLSWKSQSSCHHWIVYVIHAIFFNRNKNLSKLILLNWIGMARIGHITNEIRLQYPKRRHFLISWTGEHVVRVKNFFFHLHTRPAFKHRPKEQTIRNENFSLLFAKSFLRPFCGNTTISNDSNTTQLREYEPSDFSRFRYIFARE